MSQDLKSIEKILAKPGSRLAQLMDQVQQWRQLDERILAAFPEDLRTRCRVASVRDRRLVLLAESPVWASKIRFMQPAILAKIRQLPDLSEIEGLDVRVAANWLPAVYKTQGGG